MQRMACASAATWTMAGSELPPLVLRNGRARPQSQPLAMRRRQRSLDRIGARVRAIGKTGRSGVQREKTRAALERDGRSRTGALLVRA